MFPPGYLLTIKARTLQAALAVAPGMGGIGYSTGKTQSYFLIAVAALQFAFIYFFCYISFNSPFVTLDVLPTGKVEIPLATPHVENKDVVDTALDYGEIQPSLLG